MGSVNCENNASPSFHGKELVVDYKKADQPVLESLFIKSGIEALEQYRHPRGIAEFLYGRIRHDKETAEEVFAGAVSSSQGKRV